MRRLLYMAVLSTAAVLVFAPAAMAQETEFVPAAKAQGKQSLEEVRPENLNCVELAPGNAAEAQQKARAILNRNSSLINLSANGIQSAKKNLDEDGDGAVCEYTSSKAEGVTFEDGSGYITSSVDYRVGEYVHGSNVTYGSDPPDENNYVVEYVGTAGSSHYDGTIGIAISDPDTPWGFNYYIIYDYQELNRLGYTQAGYNKLYRHERAHTRGWNHYGGTPYVNEAYCPTINFDGTTPCYGP